MLTLSINRRGLAQRREVWLLVLNDGFLYMGSGDGGGQGSFNDPDNRGQDPSNILLGQDVKRIDVESGVKPYAHPR